VILVDANLLICAASQLWPHHRVARDWLDARPNEAACVGLPWTSLPAFLGLATNPRIFGKPASAEDAWKRVEGRLDCSNVWVAMQTERDCSVRSGLLHAAGRGANLAPDARLGALAIEHRPHSLYSADAGFGGFPGLEWENPIAAPSRH
jgi:toxin-antitoxin system PIN domain toxin